MWEFQFRSFPVLSGYPGAVYQHKLQPLSMNLPLNVNIISRAPGTNTWQEVAAWHPRTEGVN